VQVEVTGSIEVQWRRLSVFFLMLLEGGAVVYTVEFFAMVN